MMNAFFQLAGGGSELGHLLELSKGRQIDGTQISRLDRPLVKDIGNSQGDPCQSTKDQDGLNPKGVPNGGADGVSAKMAASESGESRELTQEEINEKQKAAIKEAFERIRRGEELTTAEKGNLGEMLMDQYYINQGYTPLHDRVTSLNDKGHRGIDGVYEKDGKYLICDAKYDTARLEETKDGTQMSREWINARLDDAVGPEKAEEIRDTYEDNPDNVVTEVYHFDPSPDETGVARSEVYHVDEHGRKDGDTVVAETFQDLTYPEMCEPDGGDMNA